MKTFALIAALAFVAGCGNDDDETPAPITPDQCAAATFPATTGTATINIKNYPGNQLNAAAGDLITFAVEVTKGDDRPQKLRAYQTDCQNALGDLVTFPAGQSGAEKNDTQFDLRNTDDPQVRNIIYQVPTGMSTVYLNFEVDESNNHLSYKRVTINVSGSGIIDTWSNLEIVAQGTAVAAKPSRASSSTGQTYFSCDAASNLSSVDITLATGTDGATYISSNPARFLAPISRPSGGLTTCDESQTVQITGGPHVYFTASALDFATATDADLSGITKSANELIAVTAVGQVIGFVNEDGRKGLIKVTWATDLGTEDADIKFDVKVQR